MESDLKSGESLALFQENNKKNSPILKALSRHVERWPDSVNVSREVRDLKEVFESEKHTVNIK